MSLLSPVGYLPGWMVGVRWFIVYLVFVPWYLDLGV